jgi:hypothetical protein
LPNAIGWRPAAIRHQLRQDKAPELADLCTWAGQTMRRILTLTSDMVNDGNPRRREDERARARRIAVMRAATGG